MESFYKFSVGTKRYFTFFLVVLFVGFWTIEGASARRRIELKPRVVAQVKKVLNETQGLHSALFFRKDPMVATKLQAVQFAIDGTLQNAQGIGNQQEHLERILKTAKRHIKAAEISAGDQRKGHLKDAFRQLVLLAQSYVLGKHYHIYFCSRDRSVWIQKKGRAQNPIHPETMARCGRLVRRR